MELQLVAGVAIKSIVILFTVIILILTKPIYADSYHVILIYITSGCTLVLMLGSIFTHCCIMAKCAKDVSTWMITEVVIASLLSIAWLLVCGSAATVSFRAGSDASRDFGWIAGLSGIAAFLLVAQCLIFCVQVVSRQMGSPGYNRGPPRRHVPPEGGRFYNVPKGSQV